LEKEVERMEDENTTTNGGPSIEEPTSDNHNDDPELELLEMEVNAQRQYEALVRRAFTFPY